MNYIKKFLYALLIAVYLILFLQGGSFAQKKFENVSKEFKTSPSQNTALSTQIKEKILKIQALQSRLSESQKSLYVEILYSNHSKSLQGKPLDLRKFFEMDNPKQAAKLLREHAKQYGISLDSTQSFQLKEFEVVVPNTTMSEGYNTIIHLFNGMEFTPAPGVEEALSKNVARLAVESKSEEKLVCLLQFEGELTMGDIIELLEAGVKVYEQMTPKSVIVQLPASSIEVLKSRSYIRWIGEYKDEYKYRAEVTEFEKGRAFISPLVGDKNASFEKELSLLGIIVESETNFPNLYRVKLKPEDVTKVATLWWVKWISTNPLTPFTKEGIFTLSPPKKLNTSQQPAKPAVQISRSKLVEKLSLNDLTLKASTIIIGTVTDITCLWDSTRTKIFTRITISIQQYIKGNDKKKVITIKVPGGKIGEVTQWVEDTPYFRNREKVILFLQPAYFRIVGGIQGKYTIKQEKVVGLDISVDYMKDQIKNIIKKTSSDISKSQKDERDN